MAIAVANLQGLDTARASGYGFIEHVCSNIADNIIRQLVMKLVFE